MALDLLPQNHPDVAPELMLLQIAALPDRSIWETRMTIADMVYNQVKLLPRSACS